MSVVVCKVSKDKIEMASDSIAVKGWTKINNAQNKIVKMMKYNDMIIGGCGNSDEISLLFHYMKTHTIENMDEKGVLDFIIEFRRWKNDLTGNNALNNPYIIAYKGKAFAIEGMLVFPIDDFMPLEQVKIMQVVLYLWVLHLKKQLKQLVNYVLLYANRLFVSQ